MFKARVSMCASPANESAAQRTLPVTIVTGFLGSGKTTLLNRMLTEPHGRKIAVVLNEIGDVNLDSQLVMQSQEELKIMNNGCVCCTVRGDLTKIALELIRKKVDFDYLVIETTGMADPNPVAQTFFMDENMQRHFHLDSIVTVADAFHIEKNLDEIKETQDQIGFADVILLNKVDMVEEKKLTELEKKIRSMNSVAKLVRTTKCNIPVGDVIGIGAFDLSARLELTPELGKEYHKHTHDESIQSVYIEEPRALDPEKLNRFMGLVVNELGGQVLRSKGVVNIKDDPMRHVFHGVHMTLGSAPDREWKANEERKTQMVFIGRHLPKDILSEGLALCVAK